MNEQVDERKMIYLDDAIDALGKAMPLLTTPDGCGEFDHEIQIADEAFVDCMQIIYDLPPAQRWIPVTEALPEEDGRYLTTNGQGWYEVASYAHRYSDIDAMYELPQDGGGWYIYDSEWGYCVYSSVVAWMPIEPWKGERE